jgi:fatty-acyl-CoA synthase
MSQQQTPPRTSQDIEAIEQVPLAERLTVGSTYELIQEMAAKDPERTAIALPGGGERSDRSVRLSYGALLNGVHQTANLLTDLGVEPWDVIAELLPDLLEAHLLLWGGQAAGIVCPIHPCLPVEQTIALLRAAQAKVLVAPGPEVSQDLWRKAELLRREVESINAVLQVQGPGNERDAIYAFDALLADYQASRLLTGREIASDDIAIYFHTTDTTGTPSCVPLTHGALLYAAWAFGLVTMLAPEEVLLRGLLRFFQGWWSAAGLTP